MFRKGNVPFLNVSVLDQPLHAHAADPAVVRLEDREPETGGLRALALRRHATERREEEPAQRVEVRSNARGERPAF